MDNASGFIYVFGNRSAPFIKNGWAFSLEKVEQAFQTFQEGQLANMERIASVPVQENIERIYTQVSARLDMYNDQERAVFDQAKLEALVSEAI